jgi:hypothetical protein
MLPGAGICPEMAAAAAAAAALIAAGSNPREGTGTGAEAGGGADCGRTTPFAARAALIAAAAACAALRRCDIVSALMLDHVVPRALLGSPDRPLMGVAHLTPPTSDLCTGMKLSSTLRLATWTGRHTSKADQRRRGAFTIRALSTQTLALLLVALALPSVVDSSMMKAVHDPHFDVPEPANRALQCHAPHTPKNAEPHTTCSE